MLATWGLSLLLVGLVTLIFGNTAVERPGAARQRTRSAPTRSAATSCSSSRSRSLLMLRALAGAALHAPRPDRARHDAERRRWPPRSASTRSAIYMWTFAAGAALSGLAGGVLAPLSGVLPTIGRRLYRQGLHHRHHRRRRDPLRHAVGSALFGTINQIVSFVSTPVFGEVALLGARDRPAAPAAAGHHRPLLPERDMTGQPTFGVGRIRWGWFIVVCVAGPAAAAARSTEHQHADAATDLGAPRALARR